MNPDNELRRPHTDWCTEHLRKADAERMAALQKTRRRRRHASTIALAIAILLFLAAAKGWLWLTSTFLQP